MQLNKQAYLTQLTEKKCRLQNLLSHVWSDEITIFHSLPQYYRMRAEFRIWHEDGTIFYAMAPSGEKVRSETVIRVEKFPLACMSINDLMPRLLKELQASAVLSHRLFQVEFLATLAGDMLVTLIYHQRLDSNWEDAAKELEQLLGIAIVGRSRKQKIVLSRSFVREKLSVLGRDFDYVQFEQSFSQPNAVICEKMLEWACEHIGDQSRDLLELYCGNGNFTLPLSQYFRRVLATEISKTGIAALRENITLNAVANVAVARLSAEEFTQAYKGERLFKRLQQDNIELEEYDFSTVFVDPPRAGIDANTLKLLSSFAHILYVSCNPETLAQNLAVLDKNHRVQAVALFDQFPFTPHIETGVLLEKKR